MIDENELKYYKNDIPLPFFCTAKYGSSVMDLTDYTMTLTIKKSATDTVPVLTKTATISSPSTGKGLFEWEDGDLNIAVGTYYYDVEIEKTDTITGKVYRHTIIGPTKIIILQDLTT